MKRKLAFRTTRVFDIVARNFSRGHTLGAPLLLSVFALSCSSPELFRRYATATHRPAATPDQHARLSAFVLADPLAAAAAPVQRPQFRKRIVLSIERTDALPPADRLESVTIKLTDPAQARPAADPVETARQPARFVSWDKFATQYETVDLGKLTFQNARTTELGLKAGSLGQTPVQGDIGLTHSRELREEISVRSRYLACSGALAAHEARVHEESTAGIDLAGNATLDLLVEATPAAQAQSVLQFGPLRDGSGWIKDPAKIQVDRDFIAYAARATPVVCQVSGSYVVRHVTRHDDTLTEGDDTVEFIHGRFAEQTLTLVPTEELALRVWAIQTPANDLLYLQQTGIVEFASPREAAAFLGWLRATGNTSVGGYALKIGGDNGPALDIARIGELKIYVRQTNAESGDRRPKTAD